MIKNGVLMAKLYQKVMHKGLMARYKLFGYPERVSHFPFFLMIEPTSRCNLKCKMCPRSQGGCDLSFNQFKEIIDKFPSATALRIQGLGEPLLNNDFFDMIKYARQKDIKVDTFCNGTLMDKDRALKTIGSGLNNICFSIDGVSNYESIRRGSKLDNVVRNIKEFVKIKRELKSDIQISISTVLQKENYKELSDIVELVHEMGINNYGISFPNFPAKPAQYDREQRDLFLKNKAEIETEINNVVSLAKRYGISVTTKTFEANNSICEWPWSGVNISAKGEVMPCCVLTNNVMGNIFSEDFNEIWNNSEYIRFRKWEGKNIPKECYGCVHFLKQKVIPTHA